MGLFRPSRKRDEAGLKTLNLRMALLVAGAVIGIVGMATENSVLIYLAVGVLAVGIVVRFIGSSSEPPAEP